METLPLKNKRAVIFGATGGVGAGVAKELAAQGAAVYLSGRSLTALEQLEEQLRKSGGVAYSAEVDALDEQAVNAYLDRMAKEGSIDILLNATGPQPKDYGNGTPILELPLEQFMLPLRTLVASQFITARSVARHMIRQHSGVIILVTAPPARGITPEALSIGAAFGAMESLVRSLAGGLGSAGVRVVGIRSGHMVDTRTIQWSYENIARNFGISTDEVSSKHVQSSLLKSSSTVADTAKVAAFLASDAARTITGAILNANSGRVID